MRLSKLKAAEQQLDVACRLFIAGESVLAVHTLSGAAEEILGKLAERASELSMFQRMQAAAQEHLQRSLSVKEMSRLVNTSRNDLKHAKDPNELSFSYNPDHAVVMLFRAMVNYQLATGSLTPTMEQAFLVLRERYPMFLPPSDRPGT